jgi:hypothetical protein
MKLAISILLFALCASAQIIPPMIQSPVVVQHKVPMPQPIDVFWSRVVNAISYNLEGETNGSLFLSTNVLGTNALVWSWPGITNGYLVQSVGSNGIGSTWVQVTHSRWYGGDNLTLTTLAGSTTWSNTVLGNLTTLVAPAFYRVSAGAMVVVQQSADLSFASTKNLFAEDVDNLPNNAEYELHWVPYTENVP